MQEAISWQAQLEIQIIRDNLLSGKLQRTSFKYSIPYIRSFDLSKLGETTLKSEMSTSKMHGNSKCFRGVQIESLNFP